MPWSTRAQAANVYEVSYPVWEDLRFPAQAINPPGQVSDPDRDTEGYFLFDSASTEQLVGVAQLPHGWIEGTAISPHIHVEKTSTATGNVLWRFSYEWISYDLAETGTYQTTNSVRTGTYTDVDTVIAVPAGADKFGWVANIANSGTIDGTGHTISSMLFWKIARIGGDASDTLAADLRLIEFDIHIQMNSLGSKYLTTKVDY